MFYIIIMTNEAVMRVTENKGDEGAYQVFRQSVEKGCLKTWDNCLMFSSVLLYNDTKTGS